MEIPAVTPGRRLAYVAARGFLRSVGRLSDGLTLCFDEGLTSGRMLEYIYRNRPAGRLGIGRWIDARFLAAPGWEAVRERRAILEATLERAIAELRAAGRPIALLDIASGPAGYVLAVMARVGGADLSARCRDLDERWLVRGRDEARRMGLERIAFERGDALDRDALVGLEPRPNLIVASGFYDWITDDETVRRSIGIVAETLAPGGRFALTHQMANPDLTFLNTVFTDFHHAPLVMKMRPAPLVHEWLAAGGLAVEDVRIDTRRCYTVTLARKP
ncbi:MAG TPA: class I SAM-dependent methyltransferase family protein [Dongiaceae bacterium]|nr:class I SAM-dependent methyltransferase family protein [Dongiaceae bacterium]